MTSSSSLLRLGLTIPSSLFWNMMFPKLFLVIRKIDGRSTWLPKYCLFPSIKTIWELFTLPKGLVWSWNDVKTLYTIMFKGILGFKQICDPKFNSKNFWFGTDFSRTNMILEMHSYKDRAFCKEFMSWPLFK